MHTIIGKYYNTIVVNIIIKIYKGGIVVFAFTEKNYLDYVQKLKDFKENLFDNDSIFPKGFSEYEKFSLKFINDIQNVSIDQHLKNIFVRLYIMTEKEFDQMINKLINNRYIYKENTTIGEFVALGKKGRNLFTLKDTCKYEQVKKRDISEKFLLFNLIKGNKCVIDITQKYIDLVISTFNKKIDNSESKENYACLLSYIYNIVYMDFVLENEAGKDEIFKKYKFDYDIIGEYKDLVFNKPNDISLDDYLIDNYTFRLEFTEHIKKFKEILINDKFIKYSNLMKKAIRERSTDILYYLNHFIIGKKINTIENINSICSSIRKESNYYYSCDDIIRRKMESLYQIDLSKDRNFDELLNRKIRLEKIYMGKNSVLKTVKKTLDKKEKDYVRFNNYINKNNITDEKSLKTLKLLYQDYKWYSDRYNQLLQEKQDIGNLIEKNKVEYECFLPDVHYRVNNKETYITLSKLRNNAIFIDKVDSDGITFGVMDTSFIDEYGNYVPFLNKRILNKFRLAEAYVIKHLGRVIHTKNMFYQFIPKFKIYTYNIDYDIEVYLEPLINRLTREEGLAGIGREHIEVIDTKINSVDPIEFFSNLKFNVLEEGDKQ